MGYLRELNVRKLKSFDTVDVPIWLGHAEKLPNRNFITIAEKEIIDLIRNYHDFSKADLVSYTNFSRTKITSCVDFPP